MCYILFSIILSYLFCSYKSFCMFAMSKRLNNCSLFDKQKIGTVYLCVIYPYGNIMLTQTKMRLCRTGRGMPNSLTYWNYLLTYLKIEKRERIKNLPWYCYAIERTCEPMGVDAYGWIVYWRNWKRPFWNVAQYKLKNKETEL
jgi:hypothetical protein